MSKPIGKHTPGPWKLEAGRSFVTSGGRFHLSYDSDKNGNPEWRASFCELDENAAIIVRAVNNHERLMKWLRKAQQMAWQQCDSRPDDRPLPSAWQWLANNIETALQNAEEKI